MKYILTAATALALAAPAWAQEAESADPAAEAEMEAEAETETTIDDDPMAEDPMTEDPMSDGMPDDPVTGDPMPGDMDDMENTPSPDEQSSVNDATTVATVVDAGFGTYDSDANGELNMAEFSAWMTKLRASSMTENGMAAPSPVEAEQWAASAFAAADTDQSSAVSKPELSRFLMG